MKPEFSPSKVTFCLLRILLWNWYGHILLTSGGTLVEEFQDCVVWEFLPIPLSLYEGCSGIPHGMCELCPSQVTREGFPGWLGWVWGRGPDGGGRACPHGYVCTQGTGYLVPWELYATDSMGKLAETSGSYANQICGRAKVNFTHKLQSGKTSPH